jgi:type IV secretory pathway VirJ component
MRPKARAARLLCLLLSLLPVCGQAGERLVHYGAPFGDVTLYVPDGRPRALVLFLSGDDGWQLGVVGMARHLAAHGAVVAGLDVRTYLADIAAHPVACRYLAADLETLGHRVQRELRTSDYLVPLLYGYSSGATLAYATLAQSPPGTFGGAVSLGFCPDQKFGATPLCPGPEAQLRYHPGPRGAYVFEPAPQLKDRWIAFQGLSDRTCPADVVDRFAAQVGNAQMIRLEGVGHGFGSEDRWMPQLLGTFDALLAAPARPAAAMPGAASPGAAVAVPDVSDLPLVEMPAKAGPPDLPVAMLFSGDGGWAGLDRGLAAELSARGLPVVGLSTLRYYWQPRTPEQSARDLARIMRHYLATWRREHVVLVGYSFGANVLPFIVNRLPADLRARVAGLSLLGLANDTSFEIRVSGWIPGSDIGSEPVRPEIAKLQGVRTTCLYGRGETHDPCPQLAGPTMSARIVGSGHHFSSDYAGLADAILQGADLGGTRGNGDRRD